MERTLAIGTSALRDAENGAAFLDEIAARLRLRDAPAERRRGGRADASRRVVGSRAVRRHARRRHRRRLDRADPRRPRLRGVLDEPPARLRAAHGALPRLGSAHRGRARRCRGPRPRAPPRARARRRRSASPARSRRSPRSISGSPSTTPERVHGHRIGRTPCERELDRLARLTAAERARIPALEPGRAPVIVAGAIDPGRGDATSTGSTRSRRASATSCTGPCSRRLAALACPVSGEHLHSAAFTTEGDRTMTTIADFDTAQLEALQASFSGSCSTPGDDGYDEARRSTTG